MPAWLAVLPLLATTPYPSSPDQATMHQVAEGSTTGGAGGRGGDFRCYNCVIQGPAGAGSGGSGGSAVQGSGTSTAPAALSPPRVTYWEHNNSVVYLDADGSRRRFYYAKPRPGMIDAGAKSGSLLFEGTRRQNTYSGTAYVFAGECGKFGYSVNGSVIDERKIVISGSAPRVDRNTCNVAGHRGDTLIFNLRSP